MGLAVTTGLFQGIPKCPHVQPANKWDATLACMTAQPLPVASNASARSGNETFTRQCSFGLESFAILHIALDLAAWDSSQVSSELSPKPRAGMLALAS